MLRLFSHLKNKKLVIFDYNGTILYDLKVCIDTLNVLLAEQGLPSIDETFYRQHFYFPVQKFYEQIGFDFNKISLTKLGERFFELYNQNLHQCGTYDGILDLVLKLKQLNIKTCILTALKQTELEKQLPLFGLEGLFDAAFGLQDYTAHSKIERGFELMEHMQIRPKDAILIGDTTHDLEVGEALGVPVLLLDDGHQNYERLLHKVQNLKSAHPHQVFSLKRPVQPSEFEN